MPGADPISAAILGGVGVFANLWGASKAAKAAKEAAALQVAGTQRGQIAADQVYADQRSLMDPYVRMGQLSLADLQARQFGGNREQYLPTQAPPTSGPAGGGPPLSGNQRAINDAYQANLGRGASLAEIQNRLNDPNFDILRHQRDIANSAEARAFAAKPVGSGQTPAAAAAAPVSFPAPAQSQMVTVRAPTGETAQFQQGSPQLQMALQRGAMRLS